MKEHIICVDDEEGILTALKQQLSARFGNECTIEVAQSGHDALELIEELRREGEPLAMVIVDQIMPGMKGVELLEEIHKRSPKTTKVLLTGQAGLDAVIYAINRAGLNRYISKPWDEPDLRLTVESLLDNYRLGRKNEVLVDDLQSKNRALETAKDDLEQKVKERTVELELANQRLSQLAVTDGLTGLYNHRFFQEELRQFAERAHRSGSPCSLLMIDVDHFKHYNDKHGHPAGDEALRVVAACIAEERRQVDVVARYGGEEFAVLLHDTEEQGAIDVAERIRRRVSEAQIPHATGQPAGKLTVSIGLAMYPRDGKTPEAWLSAADSALYAAKKAGRDRIVVATPKLPE